MLVCMCSSQSRCFIITVDWKYVHGTDWCLALQDMTYSGPDTKNQMVLMPSVKRR